MELTCPKCHGAMRTYERNGVHVDQCGDCRGVFLDRGELERLMDAEARFYTDGGGSRAPRHEPAAPQSPAPQPSGAQSSIGGVVGEVLQQVRSQQSGSYQKHPHQPYRKKSKSSFLGELFG